MWQELSFTAASADLDNFVPIDTGAGDSGRHYDVQGIRVLAQVDDNTNPSTLQFALVRKNQVYAKFDATVTATTRRTNAAGTGGLYVCSVEFDESENSKLDLLGDWYRNRQKNRGAGGEDAGAVWMVGCTALGAGAELLNVQIAPTTVA